MLKIVLLFLKWFSICSIINSPACNAQTFDTLTKAAMVFANFISKFGEITQQSIVSHSIFKLCT